MQIRNAREEWNRILIRKGGFHRNRNVVRRRGCRRSERRRTRWKRGGEKIGSFLPLNSKVSTFQLGHVHLYPMGAYVCTDALGIQPSSPLLMEIEKYEVKITAPRNSRIRFLGNQILEANDRIVAILVRVLESCFRKWNSRFLVRFEFRNGWISSVELNKRIASSFLFFFVIGILLSKVKKSFFHFLKNYFPRI